MTFDVDRNRGNDIESELTSIEVGYRSIIETVFFAETN
jgi:hypothetical protein